MNRKAHWHYVAIDHARMMIFIADDDGPSLSVTNDAEAVTAAAASQDEAGRDISSYRLIYRDSDGHWDELVHQRGVFKGFAPARDVTLPAEAANG